MKSDVYAPVGMATDVYRQALVFASLQYGLELIQEREAVRQLVPINDGIAPEGLRRPPHSAMWTYNDEMDHIPRDLGLTFAQWAFRGVHSFCKKVGSCLLHQFTRRIFQKAD